MFNFLRIFSVISLPAIILIAVLTGMSMRSMTIQGLQDKTELNASNLAQAYTHGIWKKYRDVIIPLAASDPAALANNESARLLAVDTNHFFQNIQLVRANIYNADGRLLISSNADGSNVLAGTTLWRLEI